MKWLIGVVFLIPTAAWASHEEDVVRINIAIQVIANQHQKPDKAPEPVKDKYEMLDFTSRACAPCQKMKPIIANLKKDFKVVEVDTDANPDWVKKYQVRYIPCLIIFKNGVEVKRFVGETDEQTLRNAMQGVFEASFEQRAPALISESIWDNCIT